MYRTLLEDLCTFVYKLVKGLRSKLCLLVSFVFWISQSNPIYLYLVCILYIYYIYGCVVFNVVKTFFFTILLIFFLADTLRSMCGHSIGNALPTVKEIISSVAQREKH